MRKTPHPRYQKLLADFAKNRPLVAGQFRAVNCAHDDWCRMLRSRGQEDCNCNPEFSYGPIPPGSFGTIHFQPAPPASHN